MRRRVTPRRWGQSDESEPGTLEKGDFTRIAESMRDSGEALVRGLGIQKGMKLLDLGCGDGTTALPAARLGAEVLGVDIARVLVDAGNRRASEQGLTSCKFQQGDASNLQDLEDRSFDLVVSIFGAMFAPRPNEVAKEMVRVMRPGGTDRYGKLDSERPHAGRANPQDQRFVFAATTGRLRQSDALVVQREVIAPLTAAGVPKENISFERDTYTFNFPETPSQLVDAFRKFYGPTMNAFEAAGKSGRATDLQNELEALFSNQNRSGNKNTTSIPNLFTGHRQRQLTGSFAFQDRSRPAEQIGVCGLSFELHAERIQLSPNDCA